MLKLYAKGIDVSVHNGNVDYTKVKAAGYNYVMIRAGYGRNVSQKDKMFETNYKNAKAVGLGVGVYWYSYASGETTEQIVTDAEAEAKACLEVIKGKQFEYPIYYDVEEASQFNKHGKDGCSAFIKKFLETVEKAGYWVGLYMSKSPLTQYVTDDIKTRYAIWVAQYNSTCTYNGQYGMWQYGIAGGKKYDTKKVVKVPGVPGECDLDFCYADYPTMIKKKGLNGFPKTEEVVITPTVPTPPVVTPTPTTNTTTLQGKEIKLSNVTLYTSATAKTGTKKTGTYYIYDNISKNNRIRITTTKSNCGKTPIGTYVTGWINKADVKIS